VADWAAPLVLDWSRGQRDTLEQAMSAGIAVVGHDCDRLVLMPECHVRGSYTFVAHSAKQEKVRLQGAED
jgi:hypothetical protein